MILQVKSGLDDVTCFNQCSAGRVTVGHITVSKNLLYSTDASREGKEQRIRTS